MVGTIGIGPLSPTMSRETKGGFFRLKSFKNNDIRIGTCARTCLELAQNLLRTHTKR